MNEPSEQQNNGQIWKQLSQNSLVYFLLLFASGWALITILKYFEYVIFVFTFAAILALLLSYPLRYLERFLSRGAALAIVITFSLVAILTFVGFLGLVIVNQSQQLVNAVTQILSTPDNPLNQLQEAIAARNPRLNLEPLEEQIQNVLTSSVNIAFASLPSLFSNYVTFILILVVAFFLLTDGDKLWRLILRLVPSHHQDRFATAIQRNFLGFLQGQLLIAFLLGSATFLVFLVFRIPFALALAVTVSAFDLIPGIGATLGVTLVCSIILVQSGWFTALKVLAICIIMQQIQDNFVAPRVIQSTVHLSPVVVFFALLVGARIAGLLGVFLAVPIAGVAISLLEIDELRSN